MIPNVSSGKTGLPFQKLFPIQKFSRANSYLELPQAFSLSLNEQPLAFAKPSEKLDQAGSEVSHHI